MNEVAEQAVPNPATTPWVPVGPSGVGLAPVVNGQWVKGVGGAAVWSAIGDADLPPRLSPVSMAIPGNDCNQALQSGWYYGVPTAANGPPSPSGYFAMAVVGLSDPASLRQIAYDYGTDAIWTRRRQTNAWGSWQGVVTTVAGPSQMIQSGSNVFTTDSAALGTIGYPVPFASAPPFVMGTNGDATAAGFTVSVWHAYDTYWTAKISDLLGHDLASYGVRVNWIAMGPGHP